MRLRVRATGVALVLVTSLVAAAAAPSSAAQGQWDRTWGEDVDSGGGTGFEVCTTAASCKAGTPGGNAAGAVTFGQGVAADPTGEAVWVSDAVNNRITKYDADGAFLLTVGLHVDNGAGNVCTVAAQCQPGATGKTGGAFDDPFGVGVDAAGHVYVADGFNQRIQEFSPSGAFVKTWGIGVSGGAGFEVCTVAASCTAVSSGSGVGGGFMGPAAVTADAAGNVYVAEQGGSRIQKFATTATTVTFTSAWGKDVVTGGGSGFEVCTSADSCTSGGFGTLGGELSAATGIAVSDAKVYVLDAGNDRVQAFTTAGAFERTWGKDVVSGGVAGFEVCSAPASCKKGEQGSGDGELAITSNPYDAVGVSETGEVYVADIGNNRVQVFGGDGAFHRAFGAAGSQGGQLNHPVSVDAGPDQAVYVVDQFNARLQKYHDSSAGAATFAFASSTATHPEQAPTEVVTVTRGGDLSVPVRVDYAMSDGSATAPEDYLTTSGTLRFTAGETTKTLNVQVVDDAVTEPDETLTVTLTNPSFGNTVVAPSAETITIVDDDSLNTTITSGPMAVTNDTTPTYTFTSNNPAATFQCSVDSQLEASFTACVSPFTTPVLSEGSHNFYVRAVLGNPVTSKDPSPAEADFSVDTTAPTTTLDVHAKSGSGTQVSPGVFTGAVEIAATQHDPAPGFPGGAPRCAVDGPSPASFDAMAATTCPVTTSTPGLHTVYAASRDLIGNTGPVVSATFRILQEPNTFIDSGPIGTTYLRTPYFGFHASVPGSTFQCRMDGAAFAACTNPYVSPPVSTGAHSFEVRATSPDGAVDPTPARRSFTLGGEHVARTTCVIQPYGYERHGGGDCYLGNHLTVCGHPGVTCATANLDCPTYTVCTVTNHGSWQDADQHVTWELETGTSINAVSTRDGYYYCDTGPEGSSCQTTSSVTAIVWPDPRVGGLIGSGSAYCVAFVPNESNMPAPGPDQSRRMECEATTRYAPSSTLQAVASGQSVQLIVPGGGTVTLSPNGSGRLARGKPLFATTTQTVRADGVVVIKPKLAKKAKKKLKQGKKVKLTVRVTYRSSAGTVVTKVSKVALQKPPKRVKHRRLTVRIPALF